MRGQADALLGCFYMSSDLGAVSPKVWFMYEHKCTKPFYVRSTEPFYLELKQKHPQCTRVVDSAWENAYKPLTNKPPPTVSGCTDMEMFCTQNSVTPVKEDQWWTGEQVLFPNDES